MEENMRRNSTEPDVDIYLEDNKTQEVPPLGHNPSGEVKKAMPDLSGNMQPVQKPNSNFVNKDTTTTFLSILVIVLAVGSIIALSCLFYYFAIRSSSLDSTIYDTSSQNTLPQKPTEVIPAFSTKVVAFKAPDQSEQLPKETKVGTCANNSLAQPYSQDSLRCTSGGVVYDPCFPTSQQTTGNMNDFAFCQMNPTVETSFLIKLQPPFPGIKSNVTQRDNWAWFLTLRDGTICAPFTGTGARVQVNGQDALYGCKSADKNQQVVLVGDLTKGTVWTAQKAILEKQNGVSMVKSTETVELDTVWQ